MVSHESDYAVALRATPHGRPLLHEGAEAFIRVGGRHQFSEVEIFDRLKRPRNAQVSASQECALRQSEGRGAQRMESAQNLVEPGG